MEIRKIKCKSGKEYSIVNEYWETRNSWGHKSTLIASWGEVQSHKVRYYNRTWECYTYQSCMFGLINEILSQNQEWYIAEYKAKHDIKRLVKGQKDEIINLKEIYQRINERSFD